MSQDIEFRYVPKHIFDIKDEIIIFDDTVAIYNVHPEPRMLVIEDAQFAKKPETALQYAMGTRYSTKT